MKLKNVIARCVVAQACTHVVQGFIVVSEARAIASAQVRGYVLRVCALAIARASETTMKYNNPANLSAGMKNNQQSYGSLSVIVTV